MTFTSPYYLPFVLLLVAVYYLLPRRWQPGVLLLGSGVFYWLLTHRYTVPVVLTGLVTWVVAVRLQRLLEQEESAVAAAKEKGADRQTRLALREGFLQKRRLWLWAFLLFSFGGLFFFKYYNALQPALAAFGLPLPARQVRMPLGVSFYTLMTVGYVLDVHFKKTAAEKSPLLTLLFTMLFPHAVEGPISRGGELLAQLGAGHTFDYDRFVMGLQRMLWGYFKKLVVADRLAPLVAAVFGAPEKYQGFVVGAAAVLFTVQLYADFSGGIDIALGTATLFGLRLPENFQRPFFSKTIPEFWRRWHITLGAWLRDYLFYPLTLSAPMAKLSKWLQTRFGKAAAKWVPAYLALFVLWIANGVWHGEGAQYIAFGLYHGFLIMLGMTAAPVFKGWQQRLAISENSFALKLFRVLRTFGLVCLGEIFFRAKNLAVALQLYRQLFSAFNPAVLWNGTLLTLGVDGKEMAVALFGMAVMLVVSLAQRQKQLGPWLYRKPLALRWAVYLAAIFVVAVFGVYGPAYDPAPFIYFQF